MDTKVMEFRLKIVLFALIFCNSLVFSQKTDSSGVFINKKGKQVIKTGSEIYFGITPAYSFRSLKPNPGLFSKPLGARSEEKGKFGLSYNLGFRKTLNKVLFIDLGVAFLRYQEQFSTTKDSTYAYVNTYRYIGIPLKLGVQFGDKFKWQVSAGIIPKMFLNEVQNIDYLDKNNLEQKKKLKFRDDFNFFTVDAVISAGFRWNFSRNVGFYFMPEARWQLSNTFQKQNGYIQKAFAYGFAVGLSILL
jgi:hypothetical protein